MAMLNYYTIISLPLLGDWGTLPPISPEQLLEHVADNPTAADLLQVIFLSNDILQREAFLAGEKIEVQPVILSADQIRNETPLPEYLKTDEQHSPRLIPTDELWERYFSHADRAARRCGSIFLAEWIGCEVALRNALVSARAKALGLDPREYYVAEQLADQQLDFTSLIDEWSMASNPLMGLQVLDKGRWEWINRHDRWFSFDNDELAAYAAKVMLLYRWQRLTQEQKNHSSYNDNKLTSGIGER